MNILKIYCFKNNARKTNFLKHYNQVNQQKSNPNFLGNIQMQNNPDLNSDTAFFKTDKNKLGSQFTVWIKENNIVKKTLDSYRSSLELLMEEGIISKSKIEKLSALTPTIKSTSYVVDEEYRTDDDKPMCFIQQTLKLQHNDELIGKYTAVYSQNGDLEDDYFDFNA